MTHILRRPSPSTVIACIALAVSLGGTSYAAVSLPRNSVGPLQIKRNAVTASKIAPRAVRTGHLAPGVVTGDKVKTGTLRTEHFGSPLPQGPPGPRGERGPAGPSDGFYELRMTSSALATTSSTLATLALPAGNYLIRTHVRLYNSSSTARALVRCGIGGGPETVVTLEPRSFSQNTVLSHADLSSAGQATLTCQLSPGTYTGTPEAIAVYPIVTATKVGTLTVTGGP